MRHLQTGGMEHLARHRQQARIARVLDAVFAIAQHRVAQRGEVTTDLVSASCLDLHLEKAGVFGGHLTLDVADRTLTVQLLLHGRSGTLITTVHDHAVVLADPARLKDFDSSIERGIIFSEQQAAGRVTIQTVYRPQRLRPVCVRNVSSTLRAPTESILDGLSATR